MQANISFRKFHLCMVMHLCCGFSINHQYCLRSYKDVFIVFKISPTRLTYQFSLEEVSMQKDVQHLSATNVCTEKNFYVRCSINKFLFNKQKVFYRLSVLGMERNYSSNVSVFANYDPCVCENMQWSSVIHFKKKEEQHYAEWAYPNKQVPYDYITYYKHFNKKTHLLKKNCKQTYCPLHLQLCEKYLFCVEAFYTICYNYSDVSCRAIGLKAEDYVTKPQKIYCSYNGNMFVSKWDYSKSSKQQYVYFCAAITKNEQSIKSENTSANHLNLPLTEISNTDHVSLHLKTCVPCHCTHAVTTHCTINFPSKPSKSTFTHYPVLLGLIIAVFALVFILVLIYKVKIKRNCHYNSNVTTSMPSSPKPEPVYEEISDYQIPLKNVAT